MQAIHLKSQSSWNGCLPASAEGKDGFEIRCSFRWTLGRDRGSDTVRFAFTGNGAPTGIAGIESDGRDPAFKTLNALLRDLKDTSVTAIVDALIDEMGKSTGSQDHGLLDMVLLEVGKSALSAVLEPLARNAVPNPDAKWILESWLGVSRVPAADASPPAAPVASGPSAGPPYANDIFAQAASRAAAQNKNILMVFRASWCAFCGPLDSFLDDPEIRPIMDKYFVRADLAVDEETHGKPYLNNPGAEDLWIEAGGRGHVPFLVIYDSQGEPIVTSNRQPTGGNIGYPAKPAEVDWFVQMVKASAPSISDAELETIHAWLTARGHN